MRGNIVILFVALGLVAGPAAAPVKHFWARDFRKQFGEFLEVPVPAGRIAVLFPNEDVLQLHGHSAHIGRSISGRRFGAGRKIENVGLRSELRKAEGDYVILLFRAPEDPDDEDEESGESDDDGEAEKEPEPQHYDPARGQPVLLRKNGKTFLLLNVHASEDGLHVELEERVQSGAGPYYSGPVHDIVFVFETAPGS